MKTDSAFWTEVRRSRRMLFKKLYVGPWISLTILLLGIIVYQAFQNSQLEIRNTELVKKIQHKTVVVGWNSMEETLEREKGVNNLEVLEVLEVTNVNRVDGVDVLDDELPSEASTGSSSRRTFIFNEEGAEAEKLEVTNVDTVDSPPNAEKLEVTIADPELLELHMLKKQFDNQEIGVRSSEAIRDDFGLIRTQGFSRENYIYAQQLGVRVEVQVIKALEKILDKKFDEYSNIFNNKNNGDLFKRELKYNLNEAVLDEFRIYWELNN